MHFTELAALTGGRLYDDARGDTVFKGVSIDSRIVKPGELFIAISGELNDGHDFIEQAINKGAIGVLSETANPTTQRVAGQVAVVGVVNSHEAMIKLAMAYRNSLKGRFVGITGSNGKTTTKELTYQLIRAVEQHAYRSPGNFNNLFGVPLALFAISKDAKVVVVEMGISTSVEMPTLAEIVHPDLIVITNVGASHLEFLGTIEAVAQAKLELVRKSDPDVPVIINADDSLLVREAKKVRGEFITFGMDSEADFTVDEVVAGEGGTSIVTIDGYSFNLPLVGKHQVNNLLAAYATFRTLGYSFEGIDTLDIPLNTAPMRGQRVVFGNITFIADCYNANPESVRAGLKAFFDSECTGRRIVILGDMLELGENAADYHRAVGKQLATGQFDKAILVGALSRHIMQAALESGLSNDRFVHFENARMAADAMKDFLHEGDFVYIKGSRGIGLEVILNSFDDAKEQN